MRRLLVSLWCFVFLFILPCLAEFPSSEQEQDSKPATDQKVIRDPAEYNAYLSALNTQAPAERAAALESFVSTYPESVMLEDALEAAMAAYQQAGNQAKVEDTAGRILEVDPDNVRALAVVVFSTRYAISRGANNKDIPVLQTLAARGLKALEHWAKPEDQTESDFEKLKQQMYAIFYGGAAFAALEQKDFSIAQQAYFRALQIDPQDLANNYQMAVACLEMENPDVKGFWYVGRTIYLAQKNEAAARQITAYGQNKYRRYHGSLDGWDDLLRRATKTTSPPLDFNVRRGQASVTATDKTPASLTSNSSPGNAHGVSASVLSSNRTPAGIAPETSGLPRGVAASILSPDPNNAATTTPASVLSSGTPGSASRTPASLMSSGSVGAAQEMSASITSSAPPASLESADSHLVRFGKTHRAGVPLVPIPIFQPASR
jgi:tetratricopeptide (TPR) repeat protein